MFQYLLSLLLILLYLLWREYQSRIRRFQECADKIPGPPGWPILGNSLDFGLTNKSVFNFLTIRIPRDYGAVTHAWLGPKLAVGLADPVYVEVSRYHQLYEVAQHSRLQIIFRAIKKLQHSTRHLKANASESQLVLHNSKNLRKSSLYKAMEPILGNGLLVNEGEIWKRHRKIIAPTFKGHILVQFLDIFNLNTDTLIRQLLPYQNGPEFDISSIMSLYALDIICESAMGVKANAMLRSESDYVTAMNGAEGLIYARVFKPWLHSDTIFRLSSYGRQWAKYMPIIHGMIKGVIKERKQLRSSEQALNVNVQTQDEGTGHGKRGAFLDYMLHYMEKGAQLTDQEVQDEVHNIMAAGHDTTAVCLGFTCWLLAKHQQIQEKAVTELRTVFGDSMRHTTLEDLNEMKYLEQILKESLRILPAVPLIARQPLEDVVTDKYTFPAGCEIGINVFMLHRHPDYFPEPEKFDPDRFLPENCVGRHPYCYIPFGGGPRICLGNKYAFYEMKVAMAQILRNFKILPPMNPFQDLDLVMAVTLKSLNGVPIRLEPRNFASGH